MDGIILENHGDIPFLKPAEIGPEIIAAMAAIAARVADAIALPIGINLLANEAIVALAIAKGERRTLYTGQSMGKRLCVQ